MSDTTETAVTVTTAAAPPAVVTGADNLLSAIVSMARDDKIDADKLERLLAMQERMEARQAEAAFNTALHLLQSEMPRVKKNGRVNLGSGKGGYDFAKWEDMDTALRPLMQRHGFSLSFDTTWRDGGGVVVTGTLLHSGGHSKPASIPLALDTGAGRNNLQAVGSSLSYGKRYVTEMLINIVREGADDDAQSAEAAGITEAQALEIEALILKTKSDRVAFMRHFGVENLLDLPTDQATAALNMLHTKARKLAAMKEAA